MSWKEFLKLAKSFVTVEQDGVRLEQMYEGANNTTYSRSHFENALNKLGMTWKQVNQNTGSAQLLEMYLNMNNSGYAFSNEQIRSKLQSEGITV